MMKYSIIASATLAITLGACGGGSSGSGSGTNTTQQESTLQLGIENSEAKSFGRIQKYISTTAANEIINELSLVGIGDVNGDGYDDLIFTPMLFWNQAKPVVLFYDKDLEKFKSDDQFQSIIPPMQHPGNILITDFDGDDRGDLYFLNTGPDDAAWGEQNVLILNTKNGFIDATYKLPSYRDSGDGAVIGDFFGDGVNDVMVLNSFHLANKSKCDAYPEVSSLVCSGTAQKNSYVLSLDGTGNIVEKTLSADLNFNNDGTNRISDGTTADYNNDGIGDIAVTYSGQFGPAKVQIMESTDIGQYTTVAEFPVTYFTDCQEVVFSIMSSVDLDADGDMEILTYETCDFGSMYWRAFDRSSSGIWNDVTDMFFPDQAQHVESMTWCKNMYFTDINDDDKNDVVCSSYGKSSIWTRNDKGFSFSTRKYKDSGKLANSYVVGYHILTLGSEKYLLELLSVSMTQSELTGWRVQ